MASKILAAGQWQTSGQVTMTSISSAAWNVGQFVEVDPRTWSGINRPGGHGMITRVHYGESGAVDSLDVKYTISRGCDSRLDPHLVHPYVEEERGGRRRKAPTIFVPPTQPVTGITTTKEKDLRRQESRQDNSIQLKRVFRRRARKRRKRGSSRVSPFKGPPPLERTELQQFSVPREIVLPWGVPSPNRRQISRQDSRTLDSFHKTSLSVVDDDDHGDCVSAMEAESSPIFCSTRSIGGGEFPSAASLPALTSPPLSASPLQRVRMSLKTVYDQQIRKASLFVQQVVEHPEEEEERETEAEAAASEILETVIFIKSPAVSLRRDDFLSTLWEALQGSDGLVEEVNLLSLAQGNFPEHSFAVADLNNYLTPLCQESKIMRADGVVYSI